MITPAVLLSDSSNLSWELRHSCIRVWFCNLCPLSHVTLIQFTGFTACNKCRLVNLYMHWMSVPNKVKTCAHPDCKFWTRVQYDYKGSKKGECWLRSTSDPFYPGEWAYNSGTKYGNSGFVLMGSLGLTQWKYGDFTCTWDWLLIMASICGHIPPSSPLQWTRCITDKKNVADWWSDDMDLQRQRVTWRYQRPCKNSRMVLVPVYIQKSIQLVWWRMKSTIPVFLIHNAFSYLMEMWWVAVCIHYTEQIERMHMHSEKSTIILFRELSIHVESMRRFENMPENHSALSLQCKTCITLEFGEEVDDEYVSLFWGWDQAV